MACLLLPAVTPAQVPHLRKQGSATQLVVDGKPFLVLGGELHNSGASSLEYMKPIWKKLKDLKLVFLWFGSWKNGGSTYPPMWVKTDLRRFPREQNLKGAHGPPPAKPGDAAAGGRRYLG
jgi:hypothetical protein